MQWHHVSTFAPLRNFLTSVRKTVVMPASFETTSSWSNRPPLRQ